MIILKWQIDYVDLWNKNRNPIEDSYFFIIFNIVSSVVLFKLLIDEDSFDISLYSYFDIFEESIF